MRANPVDLIGGYYADDTLPWSCQDTVNWLPVMAEVGGTRTPSYLKTPPGLKPYRQVGAGPIRGMHDCEGARFVVSGTTLCRINSNGTIDPLGTIPGVGRVTMTHNQFKTGNQLLVENGQGGGGYVYDTSARTFARITDEGYPGSISSDYLDSYMLGVEPQGRYWFHSNLADATDFNTLDRYESEASPDRIIGLAVSQFEVVVFNQTTIEFFYNAGSATGTFQNRRQTITRGCASRHSIAKLDNTLFWLGDDGIVYRLEGYSATPVSTGPMARAFAEKNWEEAFAFTWEDQGFKIYYLTFPDGQTWGYDVVSRLWTRRESLGLDRWRLSHMVKWGRTWYGGDFQGGRIWEVDWNYILEGDQPYVSRRTTPYLHDDQSLIGIPSAELVFDTGQGPETVAQAFPTPLSIIGLPPPGMAGVAYPAFSFSGTGGTGPYTFSIASGQLPPGLSLSSAGAITGTPLTVGNYIFDVRMFDSRANWTEQKYSIQAVVQPPSWAIVGTLLATAGGNGRVGLVARNEWNSPQLRTPTSNALDTIAASETVVLAWQRSVVGVYSSIDSGATFTNTVGIAGFIPRGKNAGVPGKWCIANAGESVGISTDGRNFVSRTVTATETARIDSIIYAYGGFNFQLRSLDEGITWIAAGRPPSVGSNNPTFGYDRTTIYAGYVEAGVVYAARSTDAVAWTAVPIEAMRTSTTIVGVARVKGSWVMAGANGDVWVNQGSAFVLVPKFATTLTGLASDGKEIIAVGGSKIYRSVDSGMTWADIPHGFTAATAFRGAAYMGMPAYV